MNRKSAPMTKPLKGNSEKYLSYREAFARIKIAKSGGFYLEAIAIQESIICDRLLSHFHGVGTIIIPNEEEIHKPKFSFGNLIQLTKNDNSSKYLYKELKVWKDNRNICLHRVAKSFPGNPTQNIDQFLFLAKHTADTGENLVRSILEWHKKSKTQKP